MNNKIFIYVLILSIIFLVSGCQTAIINDNLEGKSGEIVGILDGYEFYRETISCDAIVVNITIDGYNFGYFSSACGNTLDDIGYEIKKDNQVYSSQELVDDGKLKTKDIYNKIYMPDPFKKGEL